MIHCTGPQLNLFQDRKIFIRFFSLHRVLQTTVVYFISRKKKKIYIYIYIYIYSDFCYVGKILVALTALREMDHINIPNGRAVEGTQSQELLGVWEERSKGS